MDLKRIVTFQTLTCPRCNFVWEFPSGSGADAGIEEHIRSCGSPKIKNVRESKPRQTRFMDAPIRSYRSAEQRKKELEEDPHALDVTATSVRCARCLTTITLSGKYYSHSFMRHRQQCLSIKLFESALNEN